MKKRVIIISAIAIICVSVIFYIIWKVTQKPNFFDEKVASTLTIDVNPSIEITLNKNNYVISTKALNDDSIKILQYDFTKQSISEVIPKIIVSLKENDYLNNESDIILINVDTNNDDLSEVVETTTKKALEEAKVKATIITQKAVITEELKKLAESNNISLSKAYYIQEKIKDNTDLKIENFIDIPINEIETKVSEKKVEITTTTEEKTTQTNTNTNSTGRIGSNKKCEKVSVGLNNDEAAAKAVSAFGAKLNPSGYCDVRYASSIGSEAPDGTCAYKVEFSHRGQKCTYYVNISNGEIVTNSCTQTSISTNDNQCIIMKDMGISAREQLGAIIENDTGSSIISTVEDTYGNQYEYNISKNGSIISKKLIKEAEPVIAGSESD